MTKPMQELINIIKKAQIPIIIGASIPCLMAYETPLNMLYRFLSAISISFGVVTIALFFVLWIEKEKKK